MASTYVRQDIWQLEASQSWHPITLAYARAIAELQQRNEDDPTSWSYQAAIHGTDTTPVQPAWNQCQHGGWYFLPWHRIYLYYLERILRSVVVSQGGPEDWALPYWNYDAGGEANTIPIPFREPTLPDGSPNPLYVTERRFGINQGAGLPSEVTSPAAALGMGTYTPPPQPGFGGGQTSFQHFWSTPGGLEQTPHNVIHNAVGGPGGWMTDPNLAALDPIFWLHHANIDRLWSVWLDSAGHADPPDSSWRDQSFELFDESGNQVTMAVAEVLDTVADLDYAYDEAPSPAHAAAGQEVSMADNPDDAAGELTELLGASEESIDLAGETTSVEVALEEETNLAQAWVAAERPERLYLSIEHVDADRDPGVVYGVYVEAPGGGPDQPREHVGNVALFGTRELHEARDEDGPHDLRLVFDVTDVAQRLRERGLGEGRLRVTFEPLGLEMPEDLDVTAQAAAGVGAVEEAPAIHIGRVSFFAG